MKPVIKHILRWEEADAARPIRPLTITTAGKTARFDMSIEDVDFFVSLLGEGASFLAESPDKKRAEAAAAFARAAHNLSFQIEQENKPAPIVPKTIGSIRPGTTEEVILRSVSRWNGHGSVPDLAPDVEAARSVTLTHGGIYTALLRLEEKGFVSSSWIPGGKTRGNRRKKVYKITPEGEAALRETAQTRGRITAFLSQ